MKIGLCVWAAASLVTLVLATTVTEWFEHNRVGRFHSAGFVGGLIGLAMGSAIGVLVSTLADRSATKCFHAFVLAAQWAVSTFVAGWIGLVIGMLFAGASGATILLDAGSARMIGW